VRLYHQMLGACDQLAEGLRRLPLETGALYDEDCERLKSAEAALGRLFEQWKTIEPGLGTPGVAR
jgi:hypothetical protein